MRNIARLSDEERYELFRNTANKMKLHDDKHMIMIYVNFIYQN